MRLHLFRFSGLAVLMLAVMPACEGGQTGDLSGDRGPTGGPGLDNHNGCDEHKQKLAGFDEMTDQGTPEELLAMAEQSFDAPISWKVAPEGQAWSVGPESGMGTIHVGVTRGVSAYQLTYTTPTNAEAGPAIGSICPPPALGVEAHVSVTTDGGALAESYDVLLRSSIAGVANFSVPLELDKLQGSLAVSDSTAGAKMVQTSLEATLMSAGTTGSISGMEQTSSGTGADSTVSVRGAVLAVWPASAACEAFSSNGEGVGVPVDQAMLGTTGQDSIASVAFTEPTAITWMDDAKSTITVAIESMGDGCFQVKDGAPYDPDAGPGVSYPVKISLKSADGRLDGQYAAKLDVIGSGSSQRVAAQATVEFAVEDVQQSGFASVNVPSGSSRLLLEVDSKRVGGSVSGSVRLFAVSTPPCQTTPPAPMPGQGASSPGCSGESETQLETASWGS